jgi:hypothetical protein
MGYEATGPRLHISQELCVLEEIRKTADSNDILSDQSFDIVRIDNKTRRAISTVGLRYLNDRVTICGNGETFVVDLGCYKMSHSLQERERGAIANEDDFALSISENTPLQWHSCVIVMVLSAHCR